MSRRAQQQVQSRVCLHLIAHLPMFQAIGKGIAMTFRHMVQICFWWIALSMSLGIVACKKDSDNPTSPADTFDMGVSGPGTFTYSPLKISGIRYATPLGNLNPPGHTLPSDHIYFYWVSPDHRTPGDMDVMLAVYAPGAGVVTWVNGPTPPNVDAKVMIKMTNTFQYYLDHVVLDPSTKVGSTIKAGQVLGTSSPQSFAIDLGVINDEVLLKGFVVPSRYGYQTIHTDSPYKYFSQPLRDSLYAKVTRTGPDKDGKIDYDLPGRLVGGWFLKGLPVGDASATPDAWPKHLAFVYDMNSPGAVRVSIGGILSMRGLYAVFKNAPDPADISMANGRVGIKLISAFDFPNIIVGILAVQMIAPDTMKVQAFPNVFVDTVQFDSNASIYTR
jgi:hypothetical protein